MNLNTVTFFVLIFFSAYADISLYHRNADRQILLIEVMDPTVDPASNVIRIEITVTSQYVFTQDYQVGGICTSTGPDGIFPDNAVSDVFTLSVYCEDSNGCIPGTLPKVDLHAGEVTGKNPTLQINPIYWFLFKSLCNHSSKKIVGIQSLDR